MLSRENIAANLPLHKPRDPNKPLALAGIKVIDFTHYVAGPYATMILADMGAEVIKIESPGKGDDFRRYPPHDPALELQGGAYLWCNRNKKSLAINLKSTVGLELVKRLIKDADVLVENFSTGVMQRLGLSPDDLTSVNPRLIYCSISAYGRSGAFSDRLGFDAIVQAESGFMSMNGFSDREGVRTTATVMDVGTAMMASNVILGALFERERSGKGQYVEACLFDTAITMVGYTSMQYLFSGEEPARNGNIGPDTCPTGVFKASDVPFYLHCGNTGIFDRLFNSVVDRPDIAQDPQLRDGAGRIQHRERIFSLLQEIFEKETWAYWREKLRSAGVPAGEVRTLGGALNSEEARERNLATRIPHPDVGWLPNVSPPIRMDASPLRDPLPPPKLGEHTQDILKNTLGLTEDEIKQLHSAQVI